MEDAIPAKRARLELFINTEDESNKSTDTKFSAISETLTGNGESTLTSDSGFNEFTPPQSIEDENINVACSSQTYSFESNEFEVRIPRKEALGTEPAERDEEDEEEEDDDACSVGSTASNLSGLSNLSNISGKDWKPCAGPMSWVQQQMVKGVNPRSVLTQILGGSWQIPQGFSDLMLWHIIVNMLSEPPKRERLRHINTLEDVIRLIKVCKKVIVLTGAGVSVSCGIPDFRSKDGIYARLSVDFPDLPDPQAMFDIHYFRRDPRPFFKFAREIYPGQFTPSLCHRFIRLIEQNNKLLRNYTQNIDTLEQVAGINRVIQCHGSFAHATCQRCSHKVDAEEIKEEIFSQYIPKCKVCPLSSSSKSEMGPSADAKWNGKAEFEAPSSSCKLNRSKVTPQHSPASSRENSSGSGSVDIHSTSSGVAASSPMEPVMKPDIVFFGEGLPDEFHDRMAEDKDECDLLIVIGSSLKVRPVALIPSSIPPNVPQILINREPLNHLTFDVELLGDCDVIVSELCRRLGENWKDLSSREPLSEIAELPPRSAEGGDKDRAGSPSQPAPENAPHPKDESDIEALRACWAPKVKESMAARLPEGKYLFCGGHRYVFPGAEVYYDPDDEENESQSSDSDSSDLDEADPESLQNGSEDTRLMDEASSTPFHMRLSASSDSVASEMDGSSELIGSRRRSSQALSEDVDSLLSAASGDPANNTPDHPSEGQWGPSEPLKHLIAPISAAAPDSIEDWTSLSASLDASSSGAQIEEVDGHFEIATSAGKKPMDKLEQRSSRSQPAHCSV